MKFEGLGFSAEIDDKDYTVLEKVADSDLVGLIGGDWLKYWRWKNLVTIAGKFRKNCEENNFVPQQVAPKFLSHFFEASSQEDDETIQEIWAKLLYSESKESGSVSLKTLQILRFMTNEDARILNNLFQFVFHVASSSGMIYQSEEYRDLFNIQYADLLRLDDLGLVTLGPFLTLNPKIGQSLFPIWTKNSVIHLVNNQSDEEITLSIPIHMLTKSGFDLYQLEERMGNFESLKYIANQLKNENDKLKVTLHSVGVLREDGSYEYAGEDLLADGDEAMYE